MTQYLVLKKSDLRPSKATQGKFYTLVLRNFDNNKSYKAYIDTSINNGNIYRNWQNVKEGDVLENIGIFNEFKKLINTYNVPRIVKSLKGQE